MLAQLRAVLGARGKKNGAQLAQLSGSFYSLIPTTSGRVAPPPLDNEAIVTEKEGLLEFWLRMGFEGTESKAQLGSPIEDVDKLPLPPSLSAAACAVSDAGSIAQSTSRGASLAASQTGKPVKPMNAELCGAIFLYTGNSIYRTLNQALRENWGAVRPFRNYLRLYFEAMVPYPSACLRISPPHPLLLPLSLRSLLSICSASHSAPSPDWLVVLCAICSYCCSSSAHRLFILPGRPRDAQGDAVARHRGRPVRRVHRGLGADLVVHQQLHRQQVRRRELHVPGMKHNERARVAPLPFVHRKIHERPPAAGGRLRRPAACGRLRQPFATPARAFGAAAAG